MKNKLFFISILLHIFHGCDKSIALEEEQSISQIKAVSNPGITVVDGYTIKPSSNQLIVKFDGNLTDEQRQLIRDEFFLAFPAEKCNCGDTNIELWTIDTDVLRIEDGVASIKRRGGNGVEGDQGFEIKLNPLPGFQSSNPDAPSWPLVQIPTSSTVNIAVIDTGLDFLRNPTYLYGTNGLQECYETTSGWNFVDDTDNIMDDQGHGTAVTSIITSKLNQQNVDYRILPLKVFNEAGYGSYWDVVCAFGYIKKIQQEGGRLDIVNTSFGGLMPGVKEQSVLSGIIADISNKSVVIASAGNNGQNTDNNGNDHFLSSFTSTNLLAVGGFQLIERNAGYEPENIMLHPDSNYGKVSIDVAAPFTDNYVLQANETYLLSGTSYATALVSSVTAKIAASSRPSPNVLVGSVKQSAFQAPKLKSKIGGQRAILNN